MSSIKQIVVLANSLKLGERCIAGIDIETRKWIRPVCDTLYPEDGRIPRQIRLIDGREPELLDIIKIPLAETGNNFDFASENLSVLAGEWQYIRKANIEALRQCCGNFPHLLHNLNKYVNPSDLQNLPSSHRRTLQLVHVIDFLVNQKTATGQTAWKGTIRADKGQKLTDATITDPVFIEKLNQGYQPQNNCFVTVSLSMPYAPPQWEGEPPCWKLIAGVIEL